MSCHFNLIDEPWIPVRLLDGKRTELNLRDTLLQAKEIAVIEDTSPLVVASLHRLLLAVLYRALNGPQDIEQAKKWFDEGIPSDLVENYLKKWRGRFNLFDEAYPFFQIPSFEPKAWRAWTALAAEHNADNAKVLFDHADVTEAGTVPPADAARWMLATQTFVVGAGKSELAYTSTAPSATAAMVLPIGRHLEDTLLLNLVPQNREVFNHDQPIWERELEPMERLKVGMERAIAGLSDLYTWRARTIRIRCNEAGQVHEVAFASGVEHTSEVRDPMLAYRQDDKKGRLPLQFKERGLWRDFDSLLPDPHDHELAPAVIEHAARLTRNAIERFPHSVMVLGQANTKAKIEFWRMERFALPQAMLSDRVIRTEIRRLLADAEDTQEDLRQACRQFARHLLSRGEREPDRKDVSTFVESMPVNANYWSRLEVAFHDVLRHYTLERDPDAIRLEWMKNVRASLRESWAQHAASLSKGDAWATRALVRAEGAINKRLKILSDEIQKYERHFNSQEEAA